MSLPEAVSPVRNNLLSIVVCRAIVLNKIASLPSVCVLTHSTVSIILLNSDSLL